MEDRLEAERALFAFLFKRIRSAFLVLSELVKKIAEEPAESEAEQMDRLLGVAYLLELVGKSVDETHLTLVNEENAAR